MRVRVVLTLLLALVAVLAAGPVPGQAESEAPIAPGYVISVAHPRAAVLTVFHSAAESFLMAPTTSADRPVVAAVAGAPFALAADYEAVLLPLTAGWARYRLAVARVTPAGLEPLGEDQAEVVSFGPALKGGRLVVAAKLPSGLHELRVTAAVAVRAVGVAEWLTDEDAASLWVLVTAPGPRPTPPPLAALTAFDTAVAGAVATAPEPEPVGGLPVGAQRGAAGVEAVGAINFESGHNRTLVTRVGEPVLVWSGYELWLAEGVSAEGRAALSVRRRANDESADVAPLAEDMVALDGAIGPRRASGALKTVLRFDTPGTYPLVAVLHTRMARAGQASEDRDAVAFTVQVVGQAPTTGAIAGLVSGADGLPLDGVLVDVTDVNGRVRGTTRTNAAGAYQVEALEPAEYRVHARPDGLNYLDAWFKGQPTLRQADPVPVRAGEVTSGIDFRLTAGGTIAGRVTGMDGQGLGGIEITVGFLRAATEVGRTGTPGDAPLPVPLENVLGRARTNGEGYYAMDRLPAGKYWVRAADPGGKYWTEYYDDRPSFAEADKVPVESGEVTGSIDFALAGGGGVAGQVREQTLLTVIIPLPGMLVEARAEVDPERVVGRAVSNADGRYAIGGLPAGAYLVRASDPATLYETEWYAEAASAADARPVRVEAGSTSAPVDFTLARLAPAPRVFVDPFHTSVRLGEGGRLGVAVAAVENLGAFEVALRWDPAVVTVDSVVLGSFLGSTGRQVVPVAPQIDNSAGTLRYGAASLGPQPGASGGGILFSVQFTGRHAGATAVSIQQSTLATPGGSALAHTRSDGQIRVVECMVGDFDCNCVIDIRDVMAVVRRWGAMADDPDYDVRFDLDGDGDIDIVDVQIEASFWGRQCDAVARPTPTPTAPPAGGEVDGVPAVPLGPSAELSATPRSPAVGEVVTVAVDLTDAGEVGGFELSLTFDPARLAFVSATPGTFLSQTGRTVLTLGPTVDSGTVTFGALGLPGQPAPVGAGRLAELTFTVLSEGESEVTLASAMVVDPLEQATAVGGGSLTIGARGSAAAGEAVVPVALRRQ